MQSRIRRCRSQNSSPGAVYPRHPFPRFFRSVCHPTSLAQRASLLLISPRSGKVHDILRQLFSASQCTESLCTFAVPSRLVELKLGPMFYEGADEGINLELSKALSLRRLEIARPVNLVSSHWNFQNLRILSLATRGSASLKTTVALLESATNLSEDAESNHVGRSRLSGLHSLEVTTTGTWSGVLAYLFDRLEVPSLYALTVSFAVDHPSLWRSLTELMEDSRMPLKVFHLACQNPFYSGIPRDTDVLPVHVARGSHGLRYTP